MNRHQVLMAMALAVLACGFGNAQDPPELEADRVVELKGKIVALTLMSDSEDLVLLADVTEQRLGGRAFLCGEGVDDGETPDWRNGAFVCIPVDDIQQLAAFADLKAYKKNLDARQNRIEGKAASARVRRGPRI